MWSSLQIASLFKLKYYFLLIIFFYLLCSLSDILTTRKKQLIDYFNEITNLHSKNCLQRLLRFSMDRFNYCFDQLVPVCSGFRSLYLCRQQESKVYTKPLNSLHSSKQLFAFCVQQTPTYFCELLPFLSSFNVLVLFNVFLKCDSLVSLLKYFVDTGTSAKMCSKQILSHSSFPQWLFIHALCSVPLYTLNSNTFKLNFFWKGWATNTLSCLIKSQKLGFRILTFHLYKPLANYK